MPNPEEIVVKQKFDFCGVRAWVMITQFESPWASCTVEGRDKLRAHDATWVNGSVICWFMVCLQGASDVSPVSHGERGRHCEI